MDKEYTIFVVETINGFLTQDGTEVQNPGDFACFSTSEEAEDIREFHQRGVVEEYNLTEKLRDPTPWD